MSRSLALLFIGLFFGGGIGFLIAAANNVALEGHAHGDAAAHDHASHDHSRTTDLPADDNAPSVDLILHKDATAGWNLEILTTNFRFSPQNVNGDNHPGEGHAHLYINGEKLSRVYGHWLHIGELPSGQTTVSVSLNANDHSALSVEGQPLTAEKVIQVP